MKRIAWSIAYVATLIFVAIPSICGSNQPYSLTIAAPKEPLKSGAELRLLVTVTNTSDRSIGFARSPGTIPEEGFRYELHARDAQGSPAPPSAYVRELRGKKTVTWSSNLSRALQPGESFVDEIEITKYYDLSRPGKYTISVARPLEPWQKLGKGKVKSNSITVTITQ